VVTFARLKAAGDDRGFAASLVFRKTGGRVAAWLKPSPYTKPGLRGQVQCASLADFTFLWVILYEPLLSNGQFHGFEFH
jgi:hypothetical protein